MATPAQSWEDQFDVMYWPLKHRHTGDKGGGKRKLGAGKGVEQRLQQK